MKMRSNKVQVTRTDRPSPILTRPNSWYLFQGTRHFARPSILPNECTPPYG